MHHSEEAAKLWNRAEECRALAEVTTDEQVRFSYLTLAEAYESLAKQQGLVYVARRLHTHRKWG